MVAIVVVAGCGSGDDAAGSASTSLAVRSYDGDQLVSTTTLACTPDDVQCAKVVGLLPQLEPVENEACTLLYGGPERYVVEGTVKGEPVNLELTRQNGCNIARYDLFTEALGG